MPDAFFLSKKTRKRKHGSSADGKASSSSSSKKAVNGKGRPPRPNSTQKGKARVRQDEDIDSGSDENEGIVDMDLQAPAGDNYDSPDEDELETPAQKRLRLASLYLESVKEKLEADMDGGFDAAEMDRELIASRLKQDVMEHNGKMHKFIADLLEIPSKPVYLRTRGHRHAVTSAVASSSGRVLFTAGKDGCIVQTDLATGKHVSTIYKINPNRPSAKGKEKAVDISGHTDEILALALSDDGTLLASGGKDRKVVVWEISPGSDRGKWLRSFVGHKDAVSCLAFRKGSRQLYSASLDRTVKVFDLSQGVMGYVDTLFGHQDHVVGLDALRNETAVSCGARDRTVRFWKVVEETQLVFRGGGTSKVREVLEGGLEGMDADEEGGRKEVTTRYEEGSVDCVVMIDESTFATGGDSGSIALWMTGKKKPVFTQALAHGLHETHSSTEGTLTRPRWITALACLRYSDLLASGSHSDEIRLWKIGSQAQSARGTNSDAAAKKHALSLTLIGVLPAPGIINSLQILSLPHSTMETWSWLSSKLRASDTSDQIRLNEEASTATGVEECIVVVAGLAKEARLGRWLSAGKGEPRDEGMAPTNGSRVYALNVHRRKRML